MSNTLVGKPFSTVLAPLQNARVLSDRTEKSVPMFGEQRTRTYDVNGDGKADARLIESTIISTRRELSMLDGQGRAVDTFVSGTKLDPFFGPVETGKVWSHEHRDYAGTSSAPIFEVYEKASNETGELALRATTTFTPSGEKTKFELDKDQNGSLETIINR